MQKSSLFKKWIIVSSLLVFLGAGCGGPSQAQSLATKPVTLNIWRVFDKSSTFDETMNAYQIIHPNVSFQYKELRSDEYKKELLQAFAEGKGPDIFSIHNTWIGEYTPLIQPLPTSIQIPYSEIRGSIKKETIFTLKEQPSITQRALRSEFVDVVAQDVIRKYKANDRAETVDTIFGLPMSVDSLALYYNKELLNAAGFPEPPKTWTEFQTQVTKLTKLGSDTSIIQSGAAVGTSKNIERSFDILSLLMMQNGTKMVDDRNRATFAQDDNSGNILGLQALYFYTDFANPLKQVYTWNSSQPNSFNAFIAGKTAFFFGYSYHADLIKTSSPKLQFGIAPAPQIEGGKIVNYANYWVETVSKSSKNANWAWDFIQFATGKDQVQKYLKSSKKPTARRALINTQIEDENLSVFASQTLTTQSWYKGTDAKVTEQSLLDLIDAILKGTDAERAIKDAENKVNQTL